MILSLALIDAPDFKDITATRLMAHVRQLSSDRFEGRGPTTRGERLTVAYLTDQLKTADVRPGNPDGTYTQKVPLVGYKTKPNLTLTVARHNLPLQFPNEFIHGFPQLSPHAEAKAAGVVFAGYGIVAPEFGWDDYKGVDVKGKVVFLLGGEPSRPNAKDPAKPDTGFFRGALRTRYASRDSKAEYLRKKGAAAAVFLASAQSPQSYSVYKTFAEQEGFGLASPTPKKDQLVTTGILHPVAAERVFQAAGLDLKALTQQANTTGFAPVAVDAVADLQLDSTLRRTASHNVVGVVRGSDPQLRKEFVVFSAHWDHLGKDVRLKGDQIYNGAIDNAIGVAQLLEIARSFQKLRVKPKRSVLFIATTCEERGFLGSRYYTQHPLYPLSRHVANINLDGGNAWGRTRDVNVTGFGLSSLDAVLAQAAKRQGRSFLQESLDDDGLFFASDQIEFARAGIPAVFPFSGIDYVGRDKAFGDKKWADYGDRDYHQVTDQVRPDWDLSGAADDASWLAMAAYQIANTESRPTWTAGSELVTGRPAR